MKKIILILASVLMFASSAFAVNIGGTTSSMAVTLSNGVSINYTGAATGYIFSTYHSSGTFTFGTSSGDTKIYKAAGTNVTTAAAPTGTATGVWDATKWSAQ